MLVALVPKETCTYFYLRGKGNDKISGSWLIPFNHHIDFVSDKIMIKIIPLCKRMSSYYEWTHPVSWSDLCKVWQIDFSWFTSPSFFRQLYFIYVIRYHKFMNTIVDFWYIFLNVLNDTFFLKKVYVTIYDQIF